MRLSFRLLRTGTVVAAAFALAGCGLFGGQVNLELSEEMKQKCPPVGIVAYTGELTRFVGNSRDASAVDFRATLGKLNVTCRDSADKQGLFADITFEISATKGPASTSNSVEIPFFVNVSRGSDAVLEKNMYSSRHTFDGDKWSAYRESVTAYVPLGPEGQILNYEVLIGLQISKAELQYNIAR
jgi:hypothetical protein